MIHTVGVPAIEPDGAEWHGHNKHRPVTLETAAIFSGKSLRTLQHAAKRGHLTAWWLGGRWWTTLDHVKWYVEDYGRNRG